MSILCYISDQIKKDVTTHGIPKKKLDDFANEVEKRQSLSGFDHFPPPCLTKKKLFGYNYRMIAIEKLVGAHLVIIFLRLVIRGGNDYADFNRNPPEWAARYFDSEFDNGKLSNWVHERTTNAPPSPPPELSPEEKDFLWSTTYSEIQDDVIVCESFEWSKSFNDQRLENRLNRIPELILAGIERPPGIIHTIHLQDDPRMAIQIFNLLGSKQCLLVSATYGASQKALDEKSIDWTDELTSADSETILRFSRQSYPALVCCDQDVWIKIQRDPQANLALSPEEAEILQTAAAHDPNAAALPLFINGRAGSGKSTLLQYLFAQSFQRWGNTFSSDNLSDTAPLYFASSRELLNVAHDVVDSLLNANHRQLLSGEDSSKLLLGQLPSCFQEFLEFMYEQLPSAERERFPRDKYVDYAKFRRMWVSRFGNENQAIRDYGPQVSWHVIRGQIKGISVDDILQKEDYEELPQDERSVSKHVFGLVFDRVWKAWYEPLFRSKETWDSQDLIRFLIENDCISATHSAVFCDEAQDYTRLELEAIYRCSLFSERQVDFQSVKRVPFIFAGDPFQTLNPTGFRWETVRASFTERILRSLYRFNSRTDIPQLNYRELSFNYRSSLRIVQFCNSIQAVRASLFDHRTLMPQKTWQLSAESSAPAFFQKGDAQLEQTLGDQSDLVLIVPCEEGEEVDYVANDPYLKKYVQMDDQGTPRNVLSAARSKGLEFLRVALYGWSQRNEAAEIGKGMRNPQSYSPSIDEKLALEYFLNNLYVAASRARRRLFVIDDKSSLDQLWWFVSDESHLATSISVLPKRDAWTGQTGILVQGLPENFNEDRDDPKSIGERFEKEGRAKEDSYLLRQAAIQFKYADELSKSSECRALADLFEKRFKEAGYEFDRAGLHDESLDAYWKGRNFHEIVDLVSRHSELANHPRARMSSYLCESRHSIDSCKSLLESLLSNSKFNTHFRSDITSPEWTHSIETALNKSVNHNLEQSMVEMGPLVDCAVQLQSLGLSLSPTLVASLQYSAKRYEDVLITLGKDDGSEIFRDSKALVIIETSQKSKKPLSPGDSRIVGDYYFRNQDYRSATDYYKTAGEIERLLDCVCHAVGNESSQLADVISISISALVEAAQWSLLISFMDTGQPRPTGKNGWGKSQTTAITRAIKQHNLTLKVLIPLLAISNELSSADSRSLQEVSAFLAARLIKREAIASWWNILPRNVAGAAIERAGKDIDALEFYEKWRDSSKLDQEREYAEKRWTICKFRQAKREEVGGYSKRAASHYQEAQMVMIKYGWNETDVEDAFPSKDDLNRVTFGNQPKDHSNTPSSTVDQGNAPQSGKLGSIAYRFVPTMKWVNLESDEGLCARILITERRVTNSDVEFTQTGPSVLFCVPWNLSIEWSPTSLAITNNEGKKVIHFGE